MFRPEEQWTIELTRCTAVDEAVVLMDNWYERDSGNEGSSMSELKSSWEPARYGGLHGARQQEARSSFCEMECPVPTECQSIAAGRLTLNVTSAPVPDTRMS